MSTVLPDPTPVTELDAILADEPWGKRSIGEAIDALTGKTSVKGVERFEVIPGKAFDTTYSYATVSSETTYENEFSAEVSASYNMQYTASASASFMSKVQYSSTSMTIIASVETVTSDFGTQSDDPRLTEAAQVMARESPDKFRETFGDYYVDNAKFGGRLLVTYTCYANSSSSMTEFTAKASFGTSVMEASGATAFKNLATSYGITVDINVTLEGTTVPPELPTTIEGVPDLLKWFLREGPDKRPEHILLSPRIARLAHYANIEPSLPRKLDVDPKIFAKIQGLNARVVGVSSLLDQLPEYYGRQKYDEEQTYGERIAAIKSEFYARASQLPKDTTNYIRLTSQEVGKIMAVLEPAAALFAFYENVTGNHKDEPSEGKQTQQFGFQPDSKAPVPVAGWSVKWHAPGVPFDWYDLYINWPVENIPTDNIIVGWKVTYLKDGGHNGEWKRKTPLMGKSTGQFYLASNAWWEADWSFGVFWAGKKHFPWLESVDTAEAITETAGSEANKAKGVGETRRHLAIGQIAAATMVAGAAVVAGVARYRGAKSRNR